MLSCLCKSTRCLNQLASDTRPSLPGFLSYLVMRDTSCASIFSTLHPQSFYYKDLGNKLIHSPSFYESAKTTSLFSTRLLQCFSIRKPL